MNSLGPSLQTAWEKRNAGNITDAFAFYQSTCAEMGLIYGAAPRENFAKLQTQSIAPLEAMDFLLLEVSFLRNQRRLERAATLLDEIRALSPTDAQRSFHLHFQAGLNALASSQDHLALEAFLQARSIAQSSHLSESAQFMAWFNALLSMENLAISPEAQLEAFMEQFTQHQDQLWAAPIRAQLDAFRLRAAFRAGDLKLLSELSTLPSQTDQALYFSAWLSCLPTLKLGTTCEAARTRFHGQVTGRISPMGLPWLTQYRMRTLGGMLVDQDLRDEVKLHDQIERLYLWVWRWVVQPDPNALQKTLLLCDHILKHISGSKLENLPAEIRQMLELSVRWLGFFSGARDLDLQRSFKELPSPQGTPVPTLSCESLLLDYLFSQQAHSPTAPDTLEILLNHPASQLAGFELLSLAKSLNLLASENAANATEDEEGITAEIIQKRIRVVRINEDPKKGGKSSSTSLTSAPMSELLHLFSQSESATRQEVLWTCFGIRRYDALYHDPKLANLLSQANRLFNPFISFNTKGTHVFSTQQEGRIRLRENGPHALCFLREEGFHEKLGITEASRKPTLSTPIPQPEARDLMDPKRRQDFESLLGASRATTVRWLNQWEEKGLLFRDGSGKATLYRALPQKIDELVKEVSRIQRRSL